MFKVAKPLAIGAAILSAALTSGAGVPKSDSPEMLKAEISYGTSSDLQSAMVRRLENDRDHPRPAVIFFHGGSWTNGDRDSLEAEAIQWADAGWVSINANYRLGKLNGNDDDGKAILADALAILRWAQSRWYVDSDNIVVYGESAGGHMATWLGSKYGEDVRAIVALSPVSSISGAIAAGKKSNASADVKLLGARADEYFGYSLGTTDAHRYMDDVKAAHIVVGVNPDEWVDPDIHGRKFCNDLGDRCKLMSVDGGQHAGRIISQDPNIRKVLRRWAEDQLVN